MITVVGISADLVEEMLTTHYSIRRPIEVTKGIPESALLVNAQVTDTGILELRFLSKGNEQEEETIAIEVHHGEPYD